MNAGWEEVLSGTVGPILELLETASDYDEAVQILSSAFPQMDTSKMIDVMVQASVKARGLGDGRDG